MWTANSMLRMVGLIGVLWSASIASSRQPNIVMILADDVGREVLGCYGGTSYATPNIDRLAAEGIRCEHAYVMPVCHPTRTTLLTGQYPFRLGHPDWGTFPRSAEDRTLANFLKRAGYATAIAGKWQLALLKDDLEQPHRMGFDEYCLYGWHEGPWYYQPHIWENGKRRTDIRDRYGPDVTCEYVIDFVERHKDGPFFAFYSMELCHAETNDLDKPAPVGPNGRYDSYAEMVAKMDERGFFPYDLFGGFNRPLDDALGQIDIAFVQRDGPFRRDCRFAEPARLATARHRLVSHLRDRMNV